MFFKTIFKIIGVLILGIIGAFLFQVFIFPWMLADPYFENFEFIKSFKEGKIVVNPTQQVYIQENTALKSAIERVGKSVAVFSKTGTALVSSGLVATSDGSVVALMSSLPSGQINVFLQGEQQAHQIARKDSKANLALIKIEKNNLSTVAFLGEEEIRLGERVFLLSANSTRQNDWTVNEGIIKAFDSNVIRTNISEKSAVNGSPLFDISGKLVGLCYIDSSGQVLAMPVSKIKTFLGL